MKSEGLTLLLRALTKSPRNDGCVFVDFHTEHCNQGLLIEGQIAKNSIDLLLKL